MKFELLPNEILIECFEYLNAADIFYSFDQLNYHLHNLIRAIPLYLNFHDVRKSIFDQFCQRMLANPQIQSQIYSLRLSNKNTHGQIQAFLTLFSLNQFSHLRSLTLIDVKKDNMQQLKSMLPTLSQLIRFCLTDSNVYAEELVSTLPMSKLQTLSALSLNSVLTSIHAITPIRHLSVSSLSLNELGRIMRYTPMLQYLNAPNIGQELYDPMPVEICFSDHSAVHLKHLIITDFGCNLNDLTCFVKHTPNVKNLTISAYCDPNMLDAFRWEELIATLLPKLDSFQFKFAVNYQNKRKSFPDHFEQFQTGFWQEQHHLYIEYLLSQSSAFIYTIPYLVDSKQLPLDSVRYCNKLINNVKTFENVTDLSLLYGKITKECQYYFSNITSLTITASSAILNEYDEQQFVQTLKRIVNLSNVKHLNLPFKYEKRMPSILLKILKEAPCLSSLGMQSVVLKSLLNNTELCKYLNQMIKKLDISNSYDQQRQMSDEISDLYKIFPNIEQLSWWINDSEDLLLILNKFSKLSSLNIFVMSTNFFQFLPSFKDQASKLNFLFYEDASLSCAYTESIMFGIWIDGTSINSLVIRTIEL